MARSVEQIQQQIIEDKESRPELDAMNSTSKRAIWRLLTNVFATAMAYLEQLMDTMTAAIDLKISRAAPSTPAWIQDRVFEFQYDPLNPQYIQLIDTVPQYVTVNPSLRIITRCSVTTNLNNVVQVKVAKGAPPAALDSTELASLQGYLNDIGTGGITYSAISQSADRLYIDADVYFKGDFGAVIRPNVIAAINNYLAVFSEEQFNGSLLMSEISRVIKSVQGVVDVVLRDVRARASDVAFADATYLVQNNQVIARLWPTVAGYIVEEDTASQTFEDSLNFIVI